MKINSRPTFTKFSVHVTSGRGSDFLPTTVESDMDFRFADDVMFSHIAANGPESKTTRMFSRVRQVAAPGTKLMSTTADSFSTYSFTVGILMSKGMNRRGAIIKISS